MILDAQKKMNQPKKTSDSTHSSSNDNVKFGGIDDHGDKYKANQPLNTIIESPRSDQNSFKLTENGDLGRGSIREKMSNPSSSKKSVSSSDLSLMHSFKDIRSKNSGRSELSNNSAFDIMMENSQGTWSSSTSAFKEKRLLSIIKDDFSSDWSEKSIPNDIGLLSSTKSYVNLDDSAYQPFLLSESKLVKSYQDLAALSEPTKPKADGLDNSILMTSGIDLLGKSSNFRQEMSDNAEGVLRLLRTVKTLSE